MSKTKTTKKPAKQKPTPRRRRFRFVAIDPAEQRALNVCELARELYPRAVDAKTAFDAAECFYAERKRRFPELDDFHG